MCTVGFPFHQNRRICSMYFGLWGGVEGVSGWSSTPELLVGALLGYTEGSRPLLCSLYRKERKKPCSWWSGCRGSSLSSEESSHWCCGTGVLPSCSSLRPWDRAAHWWHCCWETSVLHTCWHHWYCEKVCATLADHVPCRGTGVWTPDLQAVLVRPWVADSTCMLSFSFW